MKAYDFINQAIGEQVYLTGDGDLAIHSHLKPFIYEKTSLKLIGLSKGGMAIVEHNGVKFKVPPKNVREYSEIKNTNQCQ